MSFEDEHGSGSLKEALDMATFEQVRPTASNDTGDRITFEWDGIGRWTFGYLPPDFIFYELWMDNPETGFILWAVTEKLQEVIDRFVPDSSLVIHADTLQTPTLAEYLKSMGFEPGDDTYIADPQRLQEWGTWVKAGAKPEDEPAWRVSKRLAGEFELDAFQPTEPDRKLD